MLKKDEAEALPRLKLRSSNKEETDLGEVVEQQKCSTVEMRSMLKAKERKKDQQKTTL